MENNDPIQGKPRFYYENAYNSGVKQNSHNQEVRYKECKTLGWGVETYPKLIPTFTDLIHPLFHPQCCLVIKYFVSASAFCQW